MNIAAQRGCLGVVKVLLESGALLTCDTLSYVVTSGDEDLMRLLISRGADVNGIGKLKITPLAAAIRLGSAEVIKMLEDRGALPIAQSDAHLSAAFEAASEVGNIHFIERLIQLRDNVGPEGLGHALVSAIRDGRDELATLLIKSHADVNVPAGPSSVGGSALLEALRQQKEALVFSLLDADANPRLFDWNEQSAMCLATTWGDRSVVEALIFAGADIDDNNESGAALTIAVKQRNGELLQLLLASGADINNPGARVASGDTALKAAVEKNDINMARYLLDQGADPNDPWALQKATLKDKELFDLLFEYYSARYPMGWGNFGTTILTHAIVKGDQFIVRQMLERGVNADVAMINMHDQRATPFGHAIARHQSNMTDHLELFLQKGCNPNSIVSQTYWHRFIGSAAPRVTAFLAAINTQDPSTVELFIRYGADVNFPARLGVKRTPLQGAAEIGSLVMVELLINHGADVNAPAAERGGGTALQLAAIGGYIPIACRLLSLKADVNAPASKVNGRTALEGAAEHGRLDMVQLLLNAGAGSRGDDVGQVKNAIALAEDNGHYLIRDLLESRFYPERQLDMLMDGNDGLFTDHNLDTDLFSL